MDLKPNFKMNLNLTCKSQQAVQRFLNRREIYQIFLVQIHNLYTAMFININSEFTTEILFISLDDWKFMKLLDTICMRVCSKIPF